MKSVTNGSVCVAVSELFKTSNVTLEKNIYFCFTDYTKAFDCVDHSKLWKILKQIGIPYHLTCLLRNLHACQEATVRTGYGTMDWLDLLAVQGTLKSLFQGHISKASILQCSAFFIVQLS